MHRRALLPCLTALVLLQACAGPAPSPSTSPSSTPLPQPSHSSAAMSPTPAPTPSPFVHTTEGPWIEGEPIALADLSGRIVTDDFEDVFAFDIDGSDFVPIADAPGSEFDASWSPDGAFVAYRDSTRGINDNDEIFVIQADGTGKRNLTDDPANDWGPDWSPDGTTIAFNSDRDGGIRGFLMNPDGSDVRRIDVDAWLEYPAWSPDGTQLVFEGAIGRTYELFIVDLATNEVRRLTESPGNDSWPAWSPDSSTIAFTSQRDDCQFAPSGAECWRDEGGADQHHDIWTIRPDGSGLRRVSPEHAQFVAWSPDGEFLLVSGHALYVVRPDGTGRLEIRTASIPRALGGIPDWTP